MELIERYASWLSCPDCSRDLDPVDDRTLGCTSGHRFDLGRRGYIGLARSGQRIPSTRDPDPRRQRTAHPSPETPGVRAAALAMLGRGQRIADVHPGTGALLAELLAGHPSRRVCALATSPQLLESVVTGTAAAGVLADTQRTWPFRDGAADVLLAIDAPLFPSEFHRVLSPGGTLIAAPRESDMPTLVDDLYLWFEHDQSRPIGDGRIALRLRRRRRMLTW
ncbi:MAG: methyltransferase domain-containing protein [Naasia sp.]